MTLPNLGVRQYFINPNWYILLGRVLATRVKRGTFPQNPSLFVEISNLLILKHLLACFGTDAHPHDLPDASGTSPVLLQALEGEGLSYLGSTCFSIPSSVKQQQTSVHLQMNQITKQNRKSKERKATYKKPEKLETDSNSPSPSPLPSAPVMNDYLNIGKPIITIAFSKRVSGVLQNGFKFVGNLPGEKTSGLIDRVGTMVVQSFDNSWLEDETKSEAPADSFTIVIGREVWNFPDGSIRRRSSSRPLLLAEPFALSNFDSVAAKIQDPEIRTLFQHLLQSNSYLLHSNTTLTSEVSTLSADIEALAPETIMSVAAEILLWCSGSEPGDHPATRAMQKLDGRWRKGMVAVYQKLVYDGKPAEFTTFLEECDGVLDRRNKEIHPRTHHILAERATRAQKMLKRHPSVVQLLVYWWRATRTSVHIPSSLEFES
ncbi:hypothetical protein DFS34DRAFT_652190 [Phlyctochytrium arcticum]|nr:hypothetical protein DFS34DRAFT_652190 [Phlyctochytrium arcticum]